MGTGERAPNPAEEVVGFDTFILSLRYGVSNRVNVTATLPYYSITSEKFQGAQYSRSNHGVGDLVVSAEYRIGTAPQLTLDAGLEVPTGNVDKVDEFGQRICDILALGSGTVDPVIGAGLWIPKFLSEHLDMFARVQHRFSGGENKWGYAFADQTVFAMHASHPLKDPWRIGVRAAGFHAGKDTWYGNVVSERGGTFLYVGPTISSRIAENSVLGAYARFPVVMDIVGSQMVAPVILGLEFSGDIRSLARPFTKSDEETE